MDERVAEFRTRAQEQFDIDPDIHDFPDGTKTAADAADAIGCDVTEIASSIVLAADQLVVAVVRGADHVDTRKLATLRNVHEATLADPDDVAEVVGWPVGGVPPFCHDSDVPVYVDEAVMENETVWAAGGSSNTVFPIDPETLRACADGTVVDVTE